ncbi:MAG: methionyl-tRNA formyltransferase [Lachnospiraceae bacterium]|nr:methionyl-tRNA formyltransferase [Lachnospiraceae bacterium]
MKIVFMGTPDIAAGVLETLIASEHDIAAVVTQPDKPNSRGNAIIFSPVKDVALKAGIRVLQPVKASSDEFALTLKEINPDIIVVVAFGQILRKNVLELAKYGCINVHASLLPKYRGASPIQWAVINGEKETGITIMQMDPGIDTGDIILQEKLELREDETAGSLFDRLTEMAGPVLLKALKQINDGTAVRTPQDENGATYVSMLKKSMGRINFNHKAEELERLIRGLVPWPGAYTFVDGKMLKIWKAVVASECDKVEALPGQIRIVDNAFFIGTLDRPLEILELQNEGKKRLPAYDFLRGTSIEDGMMTDNI